MAKTEFDLELVRSAAASRWKEIISVLGNVDISILDGRHHPCPKCGGTDRFRFFTDETGGAICNQCLTSKNGDGFSILQWLNGWDFLRAVKEVAEYLGIEPTAAKRKTKRSHPEDNLKFKEWNDVLVGMWCQQKAPISPESIKAFGGKLATYRKSWPVIAIPIWGSKLTKAKPVGWILYNLSGRTLPRYIPDQPPQWVKMKITLGSGAGIVGPVDRLEKILDMKMLFKVEGVTDALAAHQIIPSDTIAIANSNGAQERPKVWITNLGANKDVVVVHDADRPGQDGATYVGEEDGRKRPGWCPSFVEAKTVRNIQLPYPITPDHGKDFRDWMVGEQVTWLDMEFLIDRTPEYKTDELDVAQQAIEADDDPHRLARMNLARYSSKYDGATLRYWRDEWYVWKRDRYRKMHVTELKAKINLTIKEEFDRIAIAEQNDPENDEVKPARKVSSSLVNNVIGATTSMVVVSSHVELGTWLDAELREKKNYLAFQNGLLDLDALLAGEKDVMLEHTPKWFSVTCLPYSFDVNARCPRWYEFLANNLEGDQERINVLQEWAGYLLTPDTGQQKFVVHEGEGANGKSVFCAVVEAMLGEDNCSHVPLEVFGDRFSRHQTLDKLANISADVGEMDKVAEGYLKSFVSGEVMYFDRKGINGIDAYPTARLMLACNNRPRFTDRTDGIWRRMILVPWRVRIGQEKRVPNMDKSWWWEQTGELPGILNWALKGLYRLREQGDFSRSEICEEALKDYQSEVNPAKAYLIDRVESSRDGCVACTTLYDSYRQWCSDNGYKAIASRSFGKEVRKLFDVNRSRIQSGGERSWHYVGVEMQS